MPQSVSNSPAASYTPTLTPSPDGSGTLHVVWQDDGTDNFEILHVSKPAGGGWSTPVNVSESVGNSEAPRLTTRSDGALHAAWQEAGDVFYAMSRLPAAYRISQPCGPGTSITVSRTCGSPGDAYVSAVVVGGGNIPNGWFFGLDIPIATLLVQLTIGALPRHPRRRGLVHHGCRHASPRHLAADGGSTPRPGVQRQHLRLDAVRLYDPVTADSDAHTTQDVHQGDDEPGDGEVLRRGGQGTAATQSSQA